MSLINDALRRAQSDLDGTRLQEVPQGLSGIPPRRKKKGSLMMVVTLALVVLISVWGLSLFFTSSGEDTPAVNALASSSELGSPEVSAPADVGIPVPQESMEEVVATDRASAENEEVQEAPALVEQQESAVSDMASPPTVESLPVAVAVAPEPETVAAPQVVVAPAVEEARAEAPAEPFRNEEIVYHLKKMDVTAVMGDGKQVRIMLGGDVFSAGELVDLDLKLRLYGKKGSLLYFTDEQGLLYEKRI